jgi:DNA-binding CsgD family transcriptional regulator
VGTSLTEAELRVSELAAGGRSNTEIAELLFVTRKTVEFHLRRSFRKLDITSRAMLTSALESRAP